MLHMLFNNCFFVSLLWHVLVLAISSVNYGVRVFGMFSSSARCANDGHLLCCRAQRWRGLNSDLIASPVQTCRQLHVDVMKHLLCIMHISHVGL